MNRCCAILLAFFGCLRLAAAPSVAGPAEPGTNVWTERVTLPVGQGRWHTTAVGYNHRAPAPWTKGNCLRFWANASELDGLSELDGVRVGVGTAEVVRWRVFNIHAENFDEITKRLGMTSVEAEIVHKRLPTHTIVDAQGRQTAQVVDEGDCIITDARIPREWFRSTPCGCYSGRDWQEYLTTYPDKFHGTAVQTECAGAIATLIHPTLVAALGGADARVQKCVYWLAVARLGGQSESEVADAAQRRHGVSKAKADLTKTMLLRNLGTADRLGCLDAGGMAEMRQGKPATVRRGPYEGELLSVFHVIPRTVCPELDNCIANLELVPERIKSSAGEGVYGPQVDWARQLHEVGFLSDKRLKAVEKAAKKNR